MLVHIFEAFLLVCGLSSVAEGIMALKGGEARFNRKKYVRQASPAPYYLVVIYRIALGCGLIVIQVLEFGKIL